MKVFFYGLFMDERLLATKGIKPTDTSIGLVSGYGLHIGERATLVRRPNGRAYGVMMEIAPNDVTKLYAEVSVADYLPEPVTVELMDGPRFEATCYNLPAARITGTNKGYADSLLKLTKRLGFPDSYLNQVRQASE